MTFAELNLAPEILSAVEASGYTEPTEVQAKAIPACMAGGDLLVSSRTGSGKTASFVLPALERILAARQDPAKKRERGQVYGPRVLVLAPTRELAMQVSKACATYGQGINGLRVATIVGGVPYGYQLRALKGSLDVLIALCASERIEFILPAHGHVLGNAWGQPFDAADVIERLKAHRLKREAKILQVMQALPQGSMQDWVERAYDDVSPKLWPVAMRSLTAHVQRIREHQKV